MIEMTIVENLARNKIRLFLCSCFGVYNRLHYFFAAALTARWLSPTFPTAFFEKNEPGDSLICSNFAEHQHYSMGVWSQIAEYLYLKKKDPDRPKSKWIGYMHGINRLSLLIFILCLIILAFKLLRK